jgi:2-polyprenyl-6-hydroxyphenyl methylase / 3-demethylubiquinone-9 3-methyltransferase
MAKASSTRTIDANEAAHFGKMAADWWNPKGSSAMLHKLNPVRLGFVRAAVNAHWGCDERGVKPLTGKTALDVGCGAGLMSEPLARLGANVTGLDAAPENIAAAKAHAAGQGLSLTYACADVAALGGTFDLVTSMEVIEHVPDPADFLRALTARMAPGGLLILSTPNRTPLSRLGLITIGESIGGIPKGTHDWDKFITPNEMTAMAEAVGLKVTETRGISFSPAKGFVLSDNLGLNYLMALVGVVELDRLGKSSRAALTPQSCKRKGGQSPRGMMD